MKKIFAIALAAVMVLSLAACGGSAAPAAEAAAPAAEAAVEEAAPAENVAQEKVEMAAPAAAEAEDAVSGPLSEEEAAAARDAGTLVSDATTGYEYSENTKYWYYSNYPNYKDFKADGAVKVAFVCKFSGAWFTPKQESLGETVKAAGYEYLYIDANSDEGAWLDGIQNIINQDFDAVVMTPVNTALLPDAMAMLQDAGIAYLTTDDPGADAYGFYSPHYGLDDYYLHNELGKLTAKAAEDRGFFDGVADDYSDFRLVFCDSPAVEAIHLRNVGFSDAFMAAYPDIPESSIEWLDCGGSLGDEVIAKFAPYVEANKANVKKWVVSSGGAASVAPNVTVFKENGIAAEDCLIADCFSTEEPIQVMQENPDDWKNSCFGAFLASAPSGVGMGEIIIDLVENGTPIPCFTGYAFIPCDATTADEIQATYF
ncbi:MAG: substrate-binding domain-containing protein [Lachnospiraceae bacterium]|nr:substrate-binding domain-containing protein [Lachnospiraceae bacterium]